MSTGRRIIGLGSRRFLVLFVAYASGMAVVATAVLGGLHWNLRPVAPAQAGGTASEVDTTAIVGIRTFTAPGDAVIDEDVVYATQPDGTQLTLDVCSPPADLPATTDGTAGGGESAGAAGTGEAATPPSAQASPTDGSTAAATDLEDLFELDESERVLWRLLRLPRRYTDLEHAGLFDADGLRAALRGLAAADVIDVVEAAR